MSLISRNLDFFDDIDKVVDTALSSFLNAQSASTAPLEYQQRRGLSQLGVQNFSVDIVENKDNYEIIADVPGFNRSDINIEHNDGYLIISAEKKEEKEDKDKKWFRKERKYNSFYRSFIMPENIDSDKIEASLDKGVLNLVLPKLQKLPPKSTKRINIK
jgi:HSP20 family protein